MSQENLKMETKKFFLSNLQILGRLGRGSNSHVFKVQYNKDKQLYAMKVIDKKSGLYSYHSVKNQVEILKNLNHSNLIKFVDQFEDEDNHYIMMQFCNGGSINKLINTKLNQRQFLRLAYELALGIQALHCNNIVHCDLKLSNILLHKNTIKICDFGFSKKISSCTSQQFGISGTLMYLAPQIILNNSRVHLKQADIWAYGICLLTLLNCKEPYGAMTNQQLKHKIIEKKYILPSDISTELRRFIQKILQVDIKKRLNINQIIKDSIFSAIKISPIGNKQQLKQNSQKIKQLYIDEQTYIKTPLKGRPCQLSINQTDKLQTIRQSKTSIKKINLLGLTPKVYCTKNNNKITIDKNLNISLNINEIIVRITDFGEKIIIKENQDLKQYKFQEICLNVKIKFLYQYANKIIMIIKNRQIKQVNKLKDE